MVLDKEAPTFENCPEDITVTLDDPNKTVKEVTWETIRYSDNSGSAQLRSYTHSNPHTFPVGYEHRVEYIIKDLSK